MIESLKYSICNAYSGSVQKIYTLPDSRENISDQQKTQIPTISYTKIVCINIQTLLRTLFKREFSTFLITLVQSQVSKCTFLLLSPNLRFFVRCYIRTAVYFPKSLLVPQCISTCTLLQPFFLFKAFPSIQCMCVNGILASI